MFLLLIDFLFNGLGFSWVSDHWNEYQGSMSWASYRVTLQPQGTAPAPTPYFPNLRYGFTLANQAQLKARVLQAEIPVADLSPVLYDTTRFRRFSPDSVYYAWVGMRGNVFSFALGAKPAFVVLQYRAVAASGASIPSYPVQHNWHSQWMLYAWAALGLGIAFGVAMNSLNDMSETPGSAMRMAAMLALLVLAADVGYVTWCDYHTNGEWYTNKLLWAFGIFITALIDFLGSKPDPDETAPVDSSPEGVERPG